MIRSGERVKFILINLFIFSYTAVFTVLAFRKNNYEFFYYSLIVFVLLLFFQFYHYQLRLTIPLMIGLAVLGLLHFLGGNLYLDHTRLFDLHLIGWFKYDNFVHIFGTVLVTFIVYNLLYLHIASRLRRRVVPFALILIFMTLGIGVVYEMIELIAVVWFNAAQAVGDYINNALDLVYNTIGATIGTVILIFYHHRKLKNKA